MTLAFGAVRGVLTDPAIRRVFVIFGVAFLGAQMSRPYLPVLVEAVNGRADLASAIGFVTGTAALVGALVSPIGGWIGDRIGFRPVLVGGLLVGGLAAAAAAAPAERAEPGRWRPRLRRGVLGRGGDGLRAAGQRGAGGPPVGDPQPRLPAALRRRDHRPDPRRDRRRFGIWAPFAAASVVFLLGSAGVAITTVRARPSTA